LAAAFLALTVSGGAGFLKKMLIGVPWLTAWPAAGI
jgi:hypothetical protein